MGPSRSYDGTQTNVGTPGTGTPTASNVGTDEVTGTGYTSGGVTLTNVDPSAPGNPSTTATFTFGSAATWTSATFNASAAVLYTSDSGTGTAGRVVGVYDFGGTLTVSAGTLTLNMPTNDGSNALGRIA